MADQLNPSWRKVLLSGSNAHVHEITASGISAAVSNPTLQKVLVYDTNSGAFYYTGSYGGSGGGTPGGSDTYIQFNDSNTFGGLSNFTFNKNTSTPTVTIQGGTSSGNTAKLLITASNTAQAQIHLKSLRPQIWFEDSVDGTPDHYLLQNGSNLVMGTGTGVTGPITFNPTNGKIATSGDISGSKTGSFGELEGIIDTSGAQTNYRLIYNGSKFVAVPEDTTFVFSIADFDMNQSGTVLIGNGVWKSAGAITFTATYNNGPPDTATVSITGVNAPSISDFSMDSPDFETGDTNVNVNYPSNIGTIRFSLAADKGATSDTNQTDQTVYFNNFRAWGSLSNNTSLTSANITTLSSSNSNLTNTSYITISELTVGSGEYFAFAYRDALTDPAQVYCGTGDDQLTVAMNPIDATDKTPATTQISSYTNINSFSENYRIIASKLTDITDHSTTLETTSNTQVKNYIFWGRDANTGQETEAGVEALENKNSSYDDGTITGQTLTVGILSSEYVYIAIPSRYGVNDTDYQIKDNSTGLPLDVNSAVNVDITNPVGFQEEYKVYRSTNQLTKATTFTALIDTL